MPSPRTLRILVVEDDPAYLYLIRRALSQRLENIRWELTIAEDGARALSILFDEEAEDDDEEKGSLKKISMDEIECLCCLMKSIGFFFNFNNE